MSKLKYEDLSQMTKDTIELARPMNEFLASPEYNRMLMHSLYCKKECNCKGVG